MSLKTTHGTDNFVLEEGLTVTESVAIINGNWAWESISASGWFSQMKEVHRFARKSFRYVGMTYTAAKACKTAMVTAFTRSFRISVWDSSANQGQWLVQNGGSRVMADVSIVSAGGDAYDVVVQVNEDDVRFLKTTSAYSYGATFSNEIARTYGLDGNGVDNETE